MLVLLAFAATLRATSLILMWTSPSQNAQGRAGPTACPIPWRIRQAPSGDSIRRLPPALTCDTRTHRGPLALYTRRGGDRHLRQSVSRYPTTSPLQSRLDRSIGGMSHTSRKG